MQLERLTIKNFRNLADVNIPLKPGTVLVGENRSGKSNLVHALRLVLDPTLPNAERQLRREDFWDGLSDGSEDWDPFAARCEIVIAVEFGGIDEDAEALSALGQSLIEGEPMRARLTYRFAPRDAEVPEGEIPRYEWRITGGNSDDQVRGDLRGRVRMQYLSALRDVETDIAYWRRSPLRPLLEAASEKLDKDALSEVAKAVEVANAEVLKLEEIADLSRDITTRTTDLVGDENATETHIGVAPSDAQRVLRSLRLFVDPVGRPLAAASLGSLNVLYFALLQLSLDHEIETHEAAHVVLAVEEPEAHLHPHVQRLIFSDAIRSPETAERTVLVTTHSPHIVSVTPPQALVILRNDGGASTAGVASAAELEPSEWADIERYLDATRGELVFARRVLLVEGFAEAVLVPKLAKDRGLELDKAGITVCAIHGTHFSTYVRFLSALGTPWSVVTDGDPKQSKADPDDDAEAINESGETSSPSENADAEVEDGEPEEDEAELAGAVRAKRLVELLGKSGAPEEHGIFVGDVTLELDLLNVGAANIATCLRVLAENDWARPTATKIKRWIDGEERLAKDYMRIVERFGKGRFAQRLAGQESSLQAPAQVAAALDYLLP